MSTGSRTAAALTLDERERIALERGTEMYKGCTMRAEEALDEARILFQTYNKLVDRLVAQLVEKMAQCRRSEEATRAAVNLIKNEGSQEQKSTLALQLRALPPASAYADACLAEWGQSGTISKLKDRVHESAKKWDALICPDLGAADALAQVMRALEERASTAPPPVNPSKRMAAQQDAPLDVVSSSEDEAVAVLRVEEFVSTPQPVRMSAVPVVAGSAAAAPPTGSSAPSSPRPVSPRVAAPASSLTVALGPPVALPTSAPSTEPPTEDSDEPAPSAVAAATPKAADPSPREPASPHASATAAADATKTPARGNNPPPNTPVSNRRASTKLTNLFSTLRGKRAPQAAEAEETITIGAPTDVEHAAHVAYGQDLDEDFIAKIANEMLVKQKASPAAKQSLPSSGAATPPAAVVGGAGGSGGGGSGGGGGGAAAASSGGGGGGGAAPLSGAPAAAAAPSAAAAPKPAPTGSSVSSLLFGKKKAKAESDSDDDGFVISTPVDVTHQGHVGPEQAAPEVVADAVDNVINKTRAVDVDDVYAAEIPFAEEYKPE